MTAIELQPGDRVRLNELGVSRSPKIRGRTGTVVALSSRSTSVGVLFDGNKRPTTIHRSYVELDEEAKGN
jgi:ribosomal protein L21E